MRAGCHLPDKTLITCSVVPWSGVHTVSKGQFIIGSYPWRYVIRLSAEL